MMLLGLGITGVSKIVGALVGVNARRVSPIVTQMVSAERGGLAQQVLELGEDLFDQVHP
jgi:hypothetical protein